MISIFKKKNYLKINEEKSDKPNDIIFIGKELLNDINQFFQNQIV